MRHGGSANGDRVDLSPKLATLSLRLAHVLRKTRAVIQVRSSLTAYKGTLFRVNLAGSNDLFAQ